MSFLEVIESYFLNLMHPYQVHNYLKDGTSLNANGEKFQKITSYEAIGISWIFILLRAFFRIALLNSMILIILKFANENFSFISQFTQGGGLSSYYFLILSTILDVIFFPLITVLVIEFWEFVIRFFASLKGIKENKNQLAEEIMTVSLSSYVLGIIPIIGDIAQSFASMFLVYVGIRNRLDATRLEAFLIIISPLFTMGIVLSILILLFTILF